MYICGLYIKGQSFFNTKTNFYSFKSICLRVNKEAYHMLTSGETYEWNRPAAENPTPLLFSHPNLTNLILLSWIWTDNQELPNLRRNKNNQRQSTDEAQRVKMQTTENYSQALISSGGTQLAFEITWVLWLLFSLFSLLNWDLCD